MIVQAAATAGTVRHYYRSGVGQVEDRLLFGDDDASPLAETGEARGLLRRGRVHAGRRGPPSPAGAPVPPRYRAPDAGALLAATPGRTGCYPPRAPLARIVRRASASTRRALVVQPRLPVQLRLMCCGSCVADARGARPAGTRQGRAADPRPVWLQARRDAHGHCANAEAGGSVEVGDRAGLQGAARGVRVSDTRTCRCVGGSATTFGSMMRSHRDVTPAQPPPALVPPQRPRRPGVVDAAAAGPRRALRARSPRA